MLRKAISTVLALFLLIGTIVVPAHRAVNFEPANSPVADFSPMPLPKPPTAVLVADGSPLPIPKPPTSLAAA
jgi:hypothetical protein